MRFFLMMLFACTVNLSYAVDQCPSGSHLQFHNLILPRLGYWSGVAKNGLKIESLNMYIPADMDKDGYTVEYVSKNSGSGYICCYYHLQDVLTKEKSPLIGVSSTVHH